MFFVSFLSPLLSRNEDHLKPDLEPSLEGNASDVARDLERERPRVKERRVACFGELTFLYLS